jgi:hypothetical protein
MDYYELEYTVENLAEDLKKKQKAHEDEQKSQSGQSASMSKNNPYSSLGKSINIPKMPSLGSMPRL